MDTQVAIVGYGAASLNAVIGMRTSGYEGQITVFSNADARPYSPINTSYFAGGMKTREQCFPWTDEQLEALNVGCVLAPVTSLDPTAHTLIAGGESYSYEKCLVASGASPQLAGFPIVDGFEPFVLRSMADAEALAEQLQKSDSRVLISGSSMVALKVTEACLDRGARPTLLARSGHVMRRSALPQMAERFENALAEQGVELRLGQTIASLEPIAADRRAARVTFSDGEAREYDAVVVAHGVTPNLSFVEEGTLDRDKGLIVDGSMRTSDADVYAAGDVAQATNLISGKNEIAGVWKQACTQGLCAGIAMAAELAGETVPPHARYAGFIPNNTVFVHGATFISGGSIELDGNRELEVTERDGDIVACVYEQNGDVSRRLVGFNAFCAQGKPGSSVYDKGTELLRRLQEEFF